MSLKKSSSSRERTKECLLIIILRALRMDDILGVNISSQVVILGLVSYRVLNWFFSSKTWFFFGNLFWIFFSSRNHFKINISHTHSESKSKSYQIKISLNPCSSRSFQQQLHQRHIPIPPKISSYDWIELNWIFKVKKSFTIQKLLHCKFKCHGTKLMHPSS